MPITEFFFTTIYTFTQFVLVIVVPLLIFSLKYAALKQHAKQVSQGRIIVISLYSFPSKFKGDYTNAYLGQNREMVVSPKGSVQQLRKKETTALLHSHSIA